MAIMAADSELREEAADGARAIRATVGARRRGEIDLRQAAQRRARELGVLGWVRDEGDGRTALHAEGSAAAVDSLLAFLRETSGAVRIAVQAARVEGHEQFAIRGVSAGVFVVQEHAARSHHFDLRLQVEGVMRSWAVPKGPSMDPTVKRLAVQVEDHALERNDFEGPTADGGVVVWDRGDYEQGGRVPWPQALERGHAVFVLHGCKLRGGFALQRTRAGRQPQWLLVKRADEHARRGSDVLAELPASVLSGRTLEQIMRTGR
jgi:DNA ligase D-like protein (predicted 3'-phosphoesterase)